MSLFRCHRLHQLQSAKLKQLKKTNRRYPEQQLFDFCAHLDGSFSLVLHSYPELQACLKAGPKTLRSVEKTVIL